MSAIDARPILVLPEARMDAPFAPTETELKLAIAPEDADRLVGAAILPGDGEASELHAIYFDTPDRVLQRHALSLRIRRKGDQRVQTAKVAEADGRLFTRGEWEGTVTGDAPVAALAPPVDKLLGPRFDDLAPLFEVRVQRIAWQVTEGASRVELVLDRGEILAGDRAAPVCEVELELLSGEASALFALARRIDAAAPVRLGLLSKAERGYRLLAGLPTAVHADKIALDPDMDLPTAFATIAASCLGQYRANEDILLAQANAEAVHQARVAIRRLRSAMTLFKPILKEAEGIALTDRLRGLAAALGEARDLDVLTQQAATGPLRDRLSELRDKAYAAMLEKLADPDTRRLPLDLAEWLDQGVWRRNAGGEDLPYYAADALDRLRRKTRKHGRRLARLEPEARHDLRKDLKKLRYAVEFLGPLFSGEKPLRRRKRFGKALRRLQDRLGSLNDQETARHRLETLGLADEAGAEYLLASWNGAELLQEAAAARHDLLDVKPFWR